MKKQTILAISICVLLLLSSFALFCAGAETLTEAGQQLRQFDVNADGKITIGDVTTLLNYLSTGCGHNEKDLPGKVPTATEPGYTTGSYCTICREVLVEQVEIPALSDIDANLANKGVKSVYVGENGTIWLEFDDGLKIDTGVAGGGTAPLSYTVTFKDWNGDVLKTETVKLGDAATAPADPSRTGYTFAGWDKAYNNITSDLIVTATYTQNSSQKYTVTFVDYDGITLATRLVDSGDTAELPADPSKNGVIFLGWSGNYVNVTQSETVTAVYSDTKNVFVVESASGSVGDTITILVAVDGTVKTCGFNLDLFYDPELELVSYDNDLDLDIITNDTIYQNGIKLNFSSATDKTKQREIIELTFKIKDTANGSLPVWIEMTEVFEVTSSGTIENISYAMVNGVVTVE